MCLILLESGSRDFYVTTLVSESGDVLTGELMRQWYERSFGVPREFKPAVNELHLPQHSECLLKHSIWDEYGWSVFQELTRLES
jgi:hypothetical protein